MLKQMKIKKKEDISILNIVKNESRFLMNIEKLGN